MRTNLTLSTQVLSKNTTEIVNTCIEKLYKQVPYNFRNSLQQVKIATAKAENPAPLRTFKMQEQSNQRKVIKRQFYDPSNNNTDVHLLKAVMNSSKKRSLLNEGFEKKLSKRASKYKIYGSKRFGSSASSSSSSLFRRHDDRQRLYKIRHTHTNSFFNDAQQRNKTIDIKAIATPPIVHRNQTMKINPTICNVNKSMKNDLMVIDQMLKNRLNSARKAKLIKPPNFNTNTPKVPLVKTRHEQEFVRSILVQQKEQLRQVGCSHKMDTNILDDTIMKDSDIDKNKPKSNTGTCFMEKTVKRNQPNNRTLPFLGSVLHSSNVKHVKCIAPHPLEGDLESQSSKSKTSFESTSSTHLSSKQKLYNKALPSATAFVAFLKPSRFNRINHITNKKFT